MERIRRLNLYQKIILVLLAVMLAAFTIAYFVVSSRVGYAYKGAILVPHEENGSVIYTGRVHGESVSITVTADKMVTFQYEEKVYGPYIAREDPSAIPEESELAKHMTGVEILEGDTVFFRGGVLRSGGSDSQLILLDEDGSPNGLTFSYSTGDGIERDMDGNPIDQLAPSASAILTLMDGPELTSKGSWMGWFGGVFISVLTVLLILFADELFRWNLAFRIRNADRAEPSEWEIAGRYLCWTALPVMALVCYILGLTIL